MRFDINSVTSSARNAYRLIYNNKLKFISYSILALLGAIVISATFGQQYDDASQKLRGAPKRRDAPRPPATGSSDSSVGGEATIKDPYANRPRIRTKNGHLVIEASQDKNIEFKTSGSRGTVSINGHKLDQLLNVTKALEKSASISSNVDAGGLFGSAQKQGNQYELLLGNLFGAGEKIASLEKRLASFTSKFDEMDSRVVALSKKVKKGKSSIASIGKQQETMLAKLKRNDCFSAETGQPVCKNGASCIDAYDGFKCLCTGQYEGETCSQDVDECTKYQGTELGCQNGAKCVNLPGGYRCECPAQYHGVHCTELHDDCGLSSSSSLCANGKCINLPRSTPNQPRYECICDQGWTTDGINPACNIDINECLASRVPSPGAAANPWEAAGAVGWPGSGSLSPVAAYPCSQNPYVECTNLPGSFQCGPCPSGYTGNGRICVDIDECQTNNGGCSAQPLVECINTQGSRRCGFCPPGYTGDGLTCTPISACRASLNGGCHPMARCVELTGLSLSARLCVCKYPFSGDGSGPEGCRLLPASMGPAPSSDGSSTNGTGQAGAGSDDHGGGRQEATRRDTSCKPDPCFNGATCRPTDASFECICPMGWAGPTCTQLAPNCGGAYYASEGSIHFGADRSELLNSSVDQTGGSGESAAAADKMAPDAVALTGGHGARHYKCKWSLTVQSNMSIRLDFSGMGNKINPIQGVRMFLANASSVAQFRKAKPPNCDEFIDVWDRLDLGAVQYDSERRLLARFCAADSSNGNTNSINVDPSKRIAILTESHGANLEYSFMATRTQFGDPSLLFNLNWLAVAPPCGGEYRLGSSNPSGSISSPRFPEFYEPGTECRYLLHAPAGQRIRVQFAELSLLTSGSRASLAATSGGQPANECADSLTILDGAIGTDRPALFRHCANNATLSSPRIPAGAFVSSSSSVEIILASNFNSTSPLLRPKQRKGFLLTYAEEPAAPGCGGLYSRKSGIIRSGDYEPALATNQEDEAYFGMQLATYMAERSQAASGDVHPSRLMHQIGMWRSLSSMRLSWWYKTRCEYTIRPADKARNHKISIDWLEMPRDPNLDEVGLPGARLSRRWTCSRSRLTVYDGDPLDGSNRTEIMSFCSGDKYNASSPMFAPILSTGRILHLVYETAIVDDHSGSGSKNYSSMAAPPPSNLPNGFKLHYSTVCSAVYSHLDGRILVEIDREVPECVYHIALPPHNTISLVVEPKMSDSASLANGVCAAQAIFLDGALEAGSSALIGMERELRGYNLGSNGQSGGQSDVRVAGLSTGNATTRVGGDNDEAGGGQPVQAQLDLGQANSNLYKPKDSYWQYSSSQVHDIKEFEVCKLPELGFDSIWNHLSILFRLNPQALAKDQASNGGEPIQLTVRYRSEPSCGGIISELGGGKIRLESVLTPSSSGINQTTTRAKPQVSAQQQHQQASGLQNDKPQERPCAWVFKATTNQVIQFDFEAPVAEIKRRFVDWLTWSSARLNKTQSSRPEFNCSQVFQETIELYEPSLNRTRQLCPIDLLSGSNATNRWVTGSSIALMRLRNNTEPAGNTTAVGRWPGRRPLGGAPIVVNYQFAAAKGRRCGGRLLHDSGTITSPRFPFHYPPQSNCVWLIQAPNARQQIRLNVTSFQLEGSPNCLFDYLELRNGPDADSPLIGRFCGNDLQSKILISHSNLLWLHFKSDAHLSRPGFEIRYDGAQTGCGGKLTTASGQIDSPNYPYPFAHSADCEWLIEVSQANRIELTIEDLDLSSEYQDFGCPLNGTHSNYLAIYDSSGQYKASNRPLVKNCHKSQLAALNKTTIVSGSNKLFINYRSQALDNSRGFRLRYRTLCANIELIGFQGVVESPGYPNNYPARVACNWTIKAPLGSNLTLAITELDTEDNSPDNDGLAPRSLAEPVPIIDNWQLNQFKRRWHCSIDALTIWAVYSSASQTKSRSPQTSATNVTKIVSGNSTSLQPIKPNGPENSKLLNYYCGQLTKLNEADRYLELDTNVAYLAFESDRSIEGRGFRLEWRSEGCGNTQVGDTIEPIAYRESDLATNGPTECLWSRQLAKAAGTIEFTISSDMRVGGASSKQDPCDAGSLTIYDGLTDKAPILNRNCDSVRNQEKVTTSGGQALVRFYSDGNRTYGRNFQLTGRLVQRDDCLSSVGQIVTPFNQLAGSKQSPNYPDLYDSSSYHCYGQVSTNNGRIKFTVEELDIPIEPETAAAGSGAGVQSLLSQEQCKKSGNYLLFRSLVGNKIEETFCGKLDTNNPADVKRKTFVLEQEAAWIDFHTSRAELRGRWKFSYERLCGSFVQIYFDREFSTPNYPDRPSWQATSDLNRTSSTLAQLQQNQLEDRACIWQINSHFIQGADKKLHFSIINFFESSNPLDCLRVYEGADLSLKVSHFNLTDLDARFAPKIKICKQTDLTHQSLFYVSRGSDIIVLITGEASVKFRVKPFEDYCGAELHMDMGEFASLGYPEPYAANLDCTYFIMGSPASRIRLDFVDFDLPEGDSSMEDSSMVAQNSTTKCDNVDYVEIRQLPLSTMLEQRLKLAGNLFASPSDTTGLFDERQDEQESDQPTTVVPNQNTTYPQNNQTKSLERFEYLSQLYNLINYRHSSLSLATSLSSVSLGDYHESSSLVGRFCGKKEPRWGYNADFPESIILQDQALIRLRSHGPSLPVAGDGKNNRRAPRGFLAKYNLIYGGPIKVNPMKIGLIGSPRYPGKSSVNGSISWTLQTKLDYVIEFELISLDLGSVHRDCQDTLSIFDGLNPEKSLKLSRMCGFMSFSKSSKSEYNKNRASLFSSTSKIVNTPEYRAHEPQVKANLVRIIRSSTNVASVTYENRRGEGSFLLRYKCVKFNPSTMNQTNSLNLEPDLAFLPVESADLDSGGKNSTRSCSSSNLLTLGAQQNSSQVVLTSPNWPKPPPPSGIECHWLLYTHDNTQIKLTIDPAPSMADSSDSADNDDDGQIRTYKSPDYCLVDSRSERRAFIVVHDGASRLAPIIGRYCLPVAPIGIKSSGRHMLIRYVNPIVSNLPRAGRARGLFKALASVSECGGQRHIVGSALIGSQPAADMQRRKQYANNLDCKFYLFAESKDEVLVINDQMSTFDLAREPTNANCSVGDYLEIRDLSIQSSLMDFSRSQQGRLLGRYCAGHPLEYLESPGGAISLEFKTDSANVATGWSLFVSSSKPRVSCPQGFMSIQTDSLFGRITSPNWPHGFTGKRQCKYLLVAPNNQSIQVNFVRLRRPHGDEDNPEKCTDSFTYLDDNEAMAVRYKNDLLAASQSPLSGARMRDLVKTMPCNSSASTATAASDRLDELLSGSDGQLTSDQNDSFKKISGQEYEKLLRLPQSTFTIGPTRSHVLMLNYEAKNLLPNEGFVAVVRILPVTSSAGRCGGELLFKALQDSADNPTSGGNGNSNSQNIIRSAYFGSETNTNEDYIQCEWSLKSHGSDFNSDEFFLAPEVQIKYSPMASQEVDNFTTSFMVFDTFEIPPSNAGQSLVDLDFSNSYSSPKSNAVCGLNRLLITDNYYMSSIFACGNLTSSLKWLIIDPYLNSVSLRTKNLHLSGSSIGADSTSTNTEPNNNSPAKLATNTFYRGISGRLYDKNCPKVAQLMGEAIRFRSHVGYPNSSYQPGICRWQVRLSGGDYHLWFDSVNFRLPKSGRNSQQVNTGNTRQSMDCDPTKDDSDNLDYIEIRASSSGDSPLVGRICAYNQMNYTQKKPLLLSARNEIKLVFVAGINRLISGQESYDSQVDNKELNAAPNGRANPPTAMENTGYNQSKYYGFDMELARVRNISEFCRRESRMNIYWFIWSKESSQFRWMPPMDSFLYPKNTHCEIPMTLDEGSKFNFTFRGMFDFESSPDCKNDYIQIDDIIDDPTRISDQQTTATKAIGNSDKKKSKSSPVGKAKGSQQVDLSKGSGVAGRIGRWCGRVKPAGYFVSKTEKVRITFHSNDRVEGKGFQLEYAIISDNNSTSTKGNRRFKPNQDLFD